MKYPWIFPILIATGLGLAVFFKTGVGAPASHSTDTAPSVEHGQMRYATPQEILNHVHDLKKPLVLVNLWASWCEPCKEEFPALLSLRKEMAPQGVQVVFVSIDDSKDLPAAEAFLKEQHVDFPTFYKGDQTLQFVTDLYPKWEGAVPTSMLFGPDLKLLDAWEGDTSKADFQKRIERQLSGTRKETGT